MDGQQLTFRVSVTEDSELFKQAIKRVEIAEQQVAELMMALRPLLVRDGEKIKRRDVDRARSVYAKVFTDTLYYVVNGFEENGGIN